ncbi:MAG: 30S ribosomal protein S3 [Candidatus Micrarchaeia archaeon]
MAIENKFISDAIIKLNISNYLKNALSRAGFSRVEIQKTPVITRITLYLLYPGRAIGSGGKVINELTETIKEKFGIQNPQISVVEVENKMLEPMLVAKDIAEKLERGINSRRIMQQMLKSIIDNGAIGVEIVLSGKLAAKGAKHKTMRKSIGYIPKAGEVTSLIREAKIAAYPKYGAIGVKVRIAPPGTVFPDREVKKLEVPKSILNS